MKVVKAGFKIMTPIDGEQVISFIEEIGRTCYKSEDKITEGSAHQFVRNLIERGHESVLEHFNITIKFICDRGVSHEIVRHRIASYTQESTRYCNYSGGKFGNEITVIQPTCWDKRSIPYNEWYSSCAEAESYYMTLCRLGASPQMARSVLPNSLKTELVMTTNLREWRHFLKLRCSSAAHPQMREITLPLLETLQQLIPVVFDDIEGGKLS